MAILMYALAGLALFSGWLFTPNGKYARIGGVEGFYNGYQPSLIWKERHFLTADLTQHDIDSLIAVVAARQARRVK